MKYWAARDKYGDCFLYESKPIECKDGVWEPNHSRYYKVSPRLFSTLTHENSPQEVKLEIENNMTPLTREYLEARGFHESSAIETGYRSQFTATTEDYSYYISLLSTSPLIDDLLERIEGESFELVIGHQTLDGSRWANVPTHIIVSTVEQFETILGMLDIRLAGLQ